MLHHGRRRSYRKKEPVVELVKSVIFDFADNHGDATFMGVRQFDFYSGGLKIPLLFSAGSYAAYGDSLSSDYFPQFAFDTSLPKTGTPATNSWIGGFFIVTNQRIIIVFSKIQTFDEIRVNNYWAPGQTAVGVKNTKIYRSLNEYTDITYNNPIPDGVLIFDGVINQHVAADVEDEQILTLIN